MDIAVVEFYAPVGHPYEIAAIPESMLVNIYDVPNEDIGIGDLCYTVGLFRFLWGKKRSLPVVHTGNISLLDTDELIPIRDRDDESKVKHVEAYIVESQGISGLSGAPVFVRPSLWFTLESGVPPELRREHITTTRIPRARFYLLGLWQGSWDAPPSEILAYDRGANITVPVGMGLVVPTKKLLEVLNGDELKNARDEHRLALAASLDGNIGKRTT